MTLGTKRFYLLGVNNFDTSHLPCLPLIFGFKLKTLPRGSKSKFKRNIC